MPRPARDPAPAPAGDASARERIVRAATREFAERGHAGARIEAIGRAAGVNKALLYYYFPGKAALYRGLVLDHARAAEERLAAAEDPTATAAASLERMTGAVLELAADRPYAPLLLAREILDGGSHLLAEDLPVLLAPSRPVVETVRRGIARGELRPVPPDFVPILLLGAMHLFLVATPPRPRGPGAGDAAPDPRAFAHFVADLVARGLAVHPPAGAPPSSTPTGAPA